MDYLPMLYTHTLPQLCTHVPSSHQLPSKIVSVRVAVASLKSSAEHKTLQGAKPLPRQQL